HEKEAKELLDSWKNRGETVGAAPAALKRYPILAAYDHCLKCSHLFNLMDARGVISATERAALMQRVRTFSCRAEGGRLPGTSHGRSPQTWGARMNSPSSITCNVGAPTFGVRLALAKEGEQRCGFCGESRTTVFPNWNGGPFDASMNLKTNYLAKPSSNTLNVGAPTFSLPSACRGGFT